jgi:glycosyltransferase involved in cell wall biosynthesis
MSSALPLVANDDPALHSPWTRGPGVEFVDVARGELRATLERLVGDPEAARQLGAEARELVRSSFSWEAHLERLEATYRSVLHA